MVYSPQIPRNYCEDMLDGIPFGSGGGPNVELRKDIVKEINLYPSYSGFIEVIEIATGPKNITTRYFYYNKTPGGSNNYLEIILPVREIGKFLLEFNGLEVNRIPPKNLARQLREFFEATNLKEVKKIIKKEKLEKLVNII